MRVGLPVSALLHGGILAWALISLERTPPLRMPEPEPVEIAIITEDGLTRLKQGDRNAKQLEAAPSKPAPDSKAVKETPKAKPPEPSTPPPPPPEPAKVELPPPPQPEKVEAPPPKPDPIAEKIASLPPEPVGPTPEELARIEAEKKAQAEKALADKAKADKARADKAKADKAKADKAKADKAKADKAKADKALADKKKKDDFFEYANQQVLKDNDPRKRAPPPPGSEQTATNLPLIKGPAAGAPEGRDTQLTASQGAMLGVLIKQAVSKCWNINAGADGIDKIIVKLAVTLRPDGRLAEPPRVTNTMPGPLFADTASSAVRAVTQCEPYNFPKELYTGGWDRSIWTFDPRKMF